MLFYIVVALLFILTLLIESSFLGVILPSVILPDIVLVMVIVLGFLMREKRGAIIGLLGGLIQDVMFAPALGIFALSKMLIGLGAGMVGREVYRDRFFGPVLLVLSGTLLHEIFVYLLLFQFSEVIPVGWSITGTIIYQSALNTAILLLLYPAMFWLYRQRGYLGIYVD